MNLGATSSSRSLSELEAVVKGGSGAEERGTALAEIRERRLYAGPGATFEHYCRDRFGFGRNYAGKLIRAARLRCHLRGRGVPEELLPLNESAARACSDLPLWAVSAAAVRRNEQVYFIRCSTTGLIKIGKSIDPDGRLRALQTGAPGRLEMLATTSLAGEREVHRLFSGDRLLNEWFRPSPRLLRYIGGLARARAS